MYLTGIVSWPVSLLLDCWFGSHGALNKFNKDEFSAVVRIHAEKAVEEIMDDQEMEGYASADGNGDLSEEGDKNLQGF